MKRATVAMGAVAVPVVAAATVPVVAPAVTAVAPVPLVAMSSSVMPVGPMMGPA